MRIKSVYQQLRKAYGPQQWWPADSRFEVMVGAILTQNTAWINVEQAIAKLKQVSALSVEAILDSSHE
jgi:endonuclease-3 related protein